MPIRYICDVLREMRACWETRNFSYLLALIEEAQWMANNMEAALSAQHDIEWKRDEIKDLEKQIEKLEAKKKALEEVLDG